MTMPAGSTEEPSVIFTERESIPVHVVSSGAKPGKNIGTEFGYFRTYQVTSAVGPNSATPGAQRILNRSLRRHEARIVVNSSAAGQNAQDGVLIGSREEINSGQPANIGAFGGYLQIGDNITYKSQRELWVCFPVTNTAPVYVTVLDMQYASDPESYREEQQ